MKQTALLLVIAIAVVSIHPLGAAIRGNKAIGVVETVDESRRTFTMRLDAGDLREFVWDDATVFLTRPRSGLKLKVYFETDAAGQAVALRVGKAEKPAPRS